MLLAGWEVPIVKNCSMGLRAVYFKRFVKNLGNERVTQIVDKERCIEEQTFFELKLFLGCEVWSLKFYYKNNFCSSLHAFKITWIRLSYLKLNSGKRENSLTVFHRNSPKYSNDQRGKLDWNWLKFYGERNTGLHAIITPSYKQLKKLSQLQNTQLNLRTVTFLAIVKWTEINLLWLIVDGCVNKAKD